MVAAALLLSLVSATAVLHVEDAGDVDSEAARRLTEDLARGIERATRAACTIDPVVGGECGDDRCLPAIRKRNGDSEVVLLRIFRSRGILRLITERFVGTGLTATSSATADFRGESEIDRAALIKLAEQTFTGAHAASNTTALFEDPRLLRGPPRASRAPWLIGVGAVTVAALVTATFLEIHATNLRSDIEHGIFTEPDYDRQLSSYHGNRDAAVAFFGAAGVGLAGEILLLLIN